MELAIDKVTKVSCNENISVQVKGKQPNSLKNFKFFLFNFLNFRIKINFEKKFSSKRKLPLIFFS